MIRHIVMWKYKETLSENERKELFEKLSAAAENMRGNVKGLLDINLFENKNPKEKHDLCLFCTFGELSDVDSYQTDALHVVFKDIITGNVTDRVCIDG